MEEEIRLICKLAPHFSSWKNEEHGVQFESSVSGYDAVVRITMDKKHLTYATQELDVYFDAPLNKTILTNFDIRKVLIEDSKADTKIKK